MSAIEEKYWALGGKAGLLGAATGTEQPCPDGVGRHQHFKGGSIHWSPGTDAHFTRELIRQKWEAMNWEVGLLGYPTTDETVTTGGRFNEFQGGTVSWRANTDEAFETHGAIRDKWVGLGRETGLLGFPETDELATPDGRGRFVHFQHGSIYWTPKTGAHEVHGAILARWAELGWERSFLGYPTSDEVPTPEGGRASSFEGGRITWTRDGGAKEEQRAFRPRLVRATGDILIVDHETFEANQVLSEPINVPQTVRNMNTRQEFMRFRKGHGGEVRFEVDLDVLIAPDDTAFLDGEARLYEGQSESTSDLVASRSIHIEVPPDQVTSSSAATAAESGLLIELIQNIAGQNINDRGEINLRLSNRIA